MRSTKNQRGISIANKKIGTFFKTWMSFYLNDFLTLQKAIKEKLHFQNVLKLLSANKWTLQRLWAICRGLQYCAKLGLL